MGTGAEYIVVEEVAAAAAAEAAAAAAAEAAAAEAAMAAASAGGAESFAVMDGAAGITATDIAGSEVSDMMIQDVIAQGMQDQAFTDGLMNEIAAEQTMIDQMTAPALEQGVQTGAEGTQTMGEMLTNSADVTHGAGQTVQPGQSFMSSQPGTFGPQSAPGGSVTPGAPGQETYLGLTPNQWQQQLIGQGIGAGLQVIGRNMSANAQGEVEDEYLNTMNAAEAARMAELEKGMQAYTPENMAAAEAKYKADNQVAYDANRLSDLDTSSYLGVVAPDSVKDTYAATAKAGADRATTNYDNLVDMKSMSALLGMNADSLNQALVKSNMQKSVGDAATAGFMQGFQQAGQEGSIFSGAGGLVSGLGNLLLANQVSKGVKPSSISDI